MATDTAGRTIVPATYTGNYEAINVNFSDDTKTIQINQLNGRQGDIRTARIKMVQDNQSGTGTIPYSIDGLQPQIVGKDAEGHTFQISGIWNPINVSLGLFTITAPANVYQAVGLTQGAYLRLVNKDGQVVSSIPVIFDVIQDSANMANYESVTYLQSIDLVVQQLLEKFDGIKTVSDSASAVANQALQTAQKADDDASKLGVAKIKQDNEFSESNTFDKDTVFKQDLQTRDGWLSQLWSNLNNLSSRVNTIKHDSRWNTSGFGFQGGWIQADQGWDHQLKYLNTSDGNVHYTFVQGALKPQGDAGSWYSKPAMRLPSGAYYDVGSIIVAATGQSNGQAVSYSLDTTTGDITITSGQNNITAGSYTLLSFIIISTEQYS